MVQVSNSKIEKENLCYLNFNISTFPTERKFIFDNFANKYWVKVGDIENTLMGRKKFLEEIKSSKFVFCPRGNGIDTHRLWEVLYSNRIPITVKVNNYGIYKLYETLPIIILDKIEDLLDYDLIYKKYNEIISNDYNLDIIDYDYWKNKILKDI